MFSGSTANDFKMLLIFLVGLFIVWMIYGGPERVVTEEQKIFQEPLQPLGGGGTYGPANNSYGFVPLVSWNKYETTYFTVELPPGWRVVELEGVGSYVGEFTNDVSTFTFDYGQYSTHLVREGDDRYTFAYEIIDGYDAELIRPKTTDATISGVFIDRRGAEGLTVSGTNLSPGEQETLFNITRTIEF